MPEMAVPAQFRALEPPDGSERDCVVLFSEVTAELKDMAEQHVGEVLRAGFWMPEAVAGGGRERGGGGGGGRGRGGEETF